VVKKNSKKPPPKKKKTDPANGSKTAVRQAFMIFVISACMFTLGVFVGRGTAPVRFDIEKLQKELAALKQAVVERDRQQVKIYREAIKNKAELDFYEALKATEDGVKKEHFDIKIPVADTVKKQSAPVKTGTNSNGSREKTPARTRGNFTIQVASVKDGKAAVTLVEKLRQKGYAARKVLAKVPGKGIWYRVRVGGFTSKSDAAATLKRLEQDKFSGLVIQH